MKLQPPQNQYFAYQKAQLNKLRNVSKATNALRAGATNELERMNDTLSVLPGQLEDIGVALTALPDQLRGIGDTLNRLPAQIDLISDQLSRLAPPAPPATLSPRAEYVVHNLALLLRTLLAQGPRELGIVNEQLRDLCQQHPMKLCIQYLAVAPELQERFEAVHQEFIDDTFDLDAGVRTRATKVIELQYEVARKLFGECDPPPDYATEPAVTAAVLRSRAKRSRAHK